MDLMSLKCKEGALKKCVFCIVVFKFLIFFNEIEFYPTTGELQTATPRGFLGEIHFDIVYGKSRGLQRF